MRIFLTDINIDTMSSDYGTRLLRSIRRLIRAVDINSKSLQQKSDITTPQLVCLTAIAREKALTLKALSETIDLSPSTTVGIIDRLEAKGFVRRTRSDRDRRQVMISITDNGQNALMLSPSPLQQVMLERFELLPELEQSTLALALERVVELIGAHNIDASAILDVGAIPASETNAETGNSDRIIDISHRHPRT